MGEERSRVRAVQMDNLRGLLGIRRMDRVLSAWIRELCRVKKGLDERISGLDMWRRWRVMGLPRECICRRVCW